MRSSEESGSQEGGGWGSRVGGGERGLLFNGNKASVWGDEMSSGDDGGDGCTTN